MTDQNFKHTLFLLLVFHTLTAQSFFPKIIFYDPYSAKFDGEYYGQYDPANYNYYVPEIADLGINVIHTKAYNDNYINEIENAGFMTATEQDGSNSSYIDNGFVEHWPIGYNIDYDDYEKHLSGNNYNILPEYYDTDNFDPNNPIYYINCLVGTHTANTTVLDGTGFWAGLWPRSNIPINLIFHGKIDTIGNTFLEDPVVTFIVYESDNSNRSIDSDTDESNHPNPQERDLNNITAVLDTHYLTFNVENFKTPGSWEFVRNDISIVNLDSRYSAKTHVDMIWHGNVDFYLDEFWLRSQKNQDLFTDSDSINNFIDIQDTAIVQFNENGGTDVIYRFYTDEPWYNQYKSLGKVSDLTKQSIGKGYLSATGGKGVNGIQKYKYIEYAHPEEVLFNYYPIRGNYYSSISQNTTHNSDDTVLHYNRTLQDAWSELIERLHTVSYESFLRNKSFMHTVQVQSEKYSDNNIRMRNPLTSEISAQVWMALAHNAKGIMYFLYSTGIFNNIMYNGLVDIGGDSNEYDSSQGPYIPNEKYYEVKRLNKQLEILEPILLSLEWKNSFSSEQGVPSDDNPDSDYEIVSNVFSFERENPYIEVGQFTHSITGADYFILVNKRCCLEDDGECAGNESQTLDVTLNTEGNIYIEDILALKEPWDGDEHRVASRYLPEGENSFQVYLKPGEGRLFRITDGLYGDFSDDVFISGQTRIIGDLTVQPEAKMTIYPGAVIEFGLYYGTSLQIFGELEANGTQANPIEINVENTMPWNEILIDNAFVQMNHVNISDVQSVTVRNSNGNFNDCNFVLDQGLLLEGGTYNFTHSTFKATDIKGSAVSTITTPESDRYIALFDNCEFYGSHIGLLTGYNSIVELFNCNFHNNNTGIYSFGSSEPWLYLTGSSYNCNTNNKMIVNNEYGITIIQDALPFLGFELPFGGFNRFENTIDILDCNLGPYPVYALMNHWFSGAGCSSSLPNNLNGEVLYRPTVNDVFELENPESLHFQALIAEAEKNFSQAVQLYDQIITDNHEDSLAVLWSLAGINRSYQKMENVNGLKSYTDLKALEYSGTPIEKYSRNYNITANILLKDYLTAESKIMAFEHDYPYFEMMDKIEFEKALIAEYQGNNYSGRLQSDYTDVVKHCSLSAKAQERYQTVAGKYGATGYGILARMKLAGARETEDEKNIPEKYKLMTVYPNPFNPTTTIQIEIQKAGHVSLTIYNILGQPVKILSEAFMQKGTHSVQWDGKNNKGEQIPNGMYLIRLETESLSDFQKVVILK